MRKRSIANINTVVSKSKKHRKKKGAGKDKVNGESAKPNGASSGEHIKPNNAGNEEQEQEPDTPLSTQEFPSEVQDKSIAAGFIANGDTQLNGGPNPSADWTSDVEPSEPLGSDPPIQGDLRPSTPVNGIYNGSDAPLDITSASPPKTEAMLESLTKEREALREEVTQLRKSLEELRGKHDEELSDVKSQLEEAHGEKDHVKTQYRNLLGKVNTIKSQLGERLKADAVRFNMF